MSKHYLFYSILISFLVSCGSDAGSQAEAEKASYEETKKVLLDKEQSNPVNFLNIKGNDKRNILGQTVVKGIIRSSATVATYKDVDIKLSFYSKTNALLETDKETVFEVLSPGQAKNFKTKYFAPKGTDSVALEVLGAKVVSQ